MAPEMKSRKRQVPAEDDVRRTKKAKHTTGDVPPKKRNATEEAGSSIPKKAKKPKILSDVKGHKVKPDTLGSDSAIQKADSASLSKLDIAPKKSKQSKTKDAKTQPVEDVSLFEDEGDDAALDSENDSVDDQTEALLKGFESDESESLEDGEEHDFTKPNPELTKLEKKIKKKVKKARGNHESTSETPGVLYIGHVPHGFYENEMRQYFKQFGDITRLRLSRNRNTGQSKHFAFIEFKSAEVAEIVAKTMDNYLLFNHILKCKIVPPEQIHESLWKGANKRFKKVPWNKIEGRKLAQPMTEGAWEKRNEREEKRRVEKAKKLKEIGYEFTIPQLKSPKDAVAQKEQLPLVIAASDVGVSANGVVNEKKESDGQNILPPEQTALKSDEISIVEASAEFDVVAAEPSKKNKKKKSGKNVL